MRRRPIPPLVLSLAAVALFAACEGGRPAAVRSERARVGQPPVVVAIVVDQLASWVLLERLPEVSPRGGFARLLREGRLLERVSYAHAATDTAPGHAALMTGESPRRTGIYANETFANGPEVASILADPSAPLRTVDGADAGTGSSLSRLRVPTIADELRARHPDATIVSLSLKDRATLFGGGRSPSFAAYFEPKRRAFVVPSSVLGPVPTWARATLGSAAVQRAIDEVWTRSNSDGPADDAAGEGDWHGFGTRFPHAPTRTLEPGRTFRATPRADRLLLEASAAAVREYAPRGAPLLVVVSLSAFDYIGHVFGPDSAEAREAFDALDASLAWFFAELDRAAAARGYAVVLSADHGIGRVPEQAASTVCAADEAVDARRCAFVRVDPSAMQETLRSALRARLGEGDWIRGVSEPWVHLGAAALGERREAAIAVIRDVLARDPRVLRVLDGRRAAATPCASAGDEIERAVCESTPSDGLDALYVVLRPGGFFDTMYVPGFGASHGSVWPYDREVPLFVRDASGAGAGRRESAVTRFETFAKELRRLLSLNAAR